MYLDNFNISRFRATLHALSVAFSPIKLFILKLQYLTSFKYITFTSLNKNCSSAADGVSLNYRLSPAFVIGYTRRIIVICHMTANKGHNPVIR